MKKVLAMGLLLSTAVFVQSAQADNIAADESGLIREGESLAGAGRWKQASDAFLKASALNPSNIVALHDLAVSYAHCNRLHEAAECERKALAIDKNYVPAHIELAWILQKLSDRSAAQEHLKRALELEPENKIARKNLEALNLRQWRSKPEPAALEPPQLADTRKQNGSSSDSPVSKALISRGQNMFRHGKYDTARRFFEQALENSPRSTLARTCLGVALGSSGDLDGQIREERLVLESDPKNSVALCNLAWALARKGELKESLASYQKAIELNPALLDAQIGQAVLLYRTNKPEAAIAVLKEALRLKPNSSALNLSLGAVMQASGRIEEAVPHLQEALRLAPNHLEAKNRLAAAYLSSDNFAKSLDLYKQLVEQDPNNAELRIGLGLSQTKCNDINSAYREFKKAAELDKNLAAPHACLSMIDELRGQLSKAEAEARIAREKDPDTLFFKDSLERLAKSRSDSQM